MRTDFKENSIIIIEDNIKKEFIKNLRKTEPLKNIKVMGLKEFEKKYYFDYTKETIFYIHKKYNVIKSIAEMYIKNIYFIDNVDDEKVSFLKEIKNDLKENSLLIEDEIFKEYLKDKTIYIYNLNLVDKYYERMFKELNLISDVEYYNDETKESTIKPLYMMPNKDIEIEFIASKIASLLKSGIDINKIKLANVQDDYVVPLKNIMNDFHIPFEFKYSDSMLSSNIVIKFDELFKNDIEKCLEELKTCVFTPHDEEIYKAIIDVVNEYYWANDYESVKEFIMDDISKIKIRSPKYKNAVRTIDFLNDNIKDDEHVFLINFNQQVFPITKKDEDYLNDELKIRLNISDSIDLNKKTIKKVHEKIGNVKNLYVSYSKNSISGELYISSAYDKSLFKEEIYERDFTNSNAYNLKELIKEKDENRKYGTKTETLNKLTNHYKEIPYMNYDNTFKGINKNLLMDKLNGKLTLSYSSMNTYYMCSFRYYLDNILKMDTFEDTFEITVGNIFHRVLSFAFNDNFDFEKSWEKSLKETEREFTTKEKFFLKILKPELLFIIENIKEGLEHTSLKKSLYEQKISIPIGDTGDTIFKGFVDKIIYGEVNGKLIAVIIDYKTGNPELKLDNIIYGLDMQLPVYAYLIGNYEPLKDALIGGFYLQKILNNINSTDKKINALKLQGYSNSDTNILRYVDDSYEDSKIIKSLKIGSNGFYAYSKVLSTENIEKLKGIVEDKIKEASEGIKNAKFDINPKEINNKMYGCKFCKYKDICFTTQKDAKKLKSITIKEVLGGEENAIMD